MRISGERKGGGGGGKYDRMRGDGGVTARMGKRVGENGDMEMMDECYRRVWYVLTSVRVVGESRRMAGMG